MHSKKRDHTGVTPTGWELGPSQKDSLGKKTKQNGSLDASGESRRSAELGVAAPLLTTREGSLT